MRGSAVTLAVNAAAKPVITIAPISAVPSEEPSCWAVYCNPPASLRSLSCTADCTTLPSCETTSPIPTPSTAIATLKSAVSSCGWIVPSRKPIAASKKRKPTRTIARGEKRVARRAPTTAITSSATDVGSMRTPVCSASSPCTTCRYSGTAKKTPISTRFWPRNITRPLRSTARLSSAKCISGLRSRSSSRRSQARNATSSTPPAATTNGASEKPNGSIGEFRGASQPHLLAFSTPKTSKPRPSALRIEPTQSSRGTGPSRGASRTSRGVASTIAVAITTSPANTRRQVSSVVSQPPRIGPTAIAAPETPPSTP